MALLDIPNQNCWKLDEYWWGKMLFETQTGHLNYLNSFFFYQQLYYLTVNCNSLFLPHSILMPKRMLNILYVWKLQFFVNSYEFKLRIYFPRTIPTLLVPGKCHLYCKTLKWLHIYYILFKCWLVAQPQSRTLKYLF